VSERGGVVAGVASWRLRWVWLGRGVVVRSFAQTGRRQRHAPTSDGGRNPNVGGPFDGIRTRWSRSWRCGSAVGAVGADWTWQVVRSDTQAGRRQRHVPTSGGDEAGGCRGG
jgi:hypothetical protein